MANRIAGETSIKVENETWVHRPSFGAIMEIEDRLGGIVGLAKKAAAGDFGLREVATILWATLLPVNGRQPELEEVGNAVVSMGIANVLPAVRNLLTQILSGGNSPSDS